MVENISLSISGTVADLSRRIEKIGQKFGMPVNPEALVLTLSVGEQQRVEIIRCLMQNPKLLIMDEPTSVLPPKGVEQLFHTLRKLVDEDNVSILFISNIYGKFHDFERFAV